MKLKVEISGSSTSFFCRDIPLRPLSRGRRSATLLQRPLRHSIHLRLCRCRRCPADSAQWPGGGEDGGHWGGWTAHLHQEHRLRQTTEPGTDLQEQEKWDRVLFLWGFFIKRDWYRNVFLNIQYVISSPFPFLFQGRSRQTPLQSCWWWVSGCVTNHFHPQENLPFFSPHVL